METLEKMQIILTKNQEGLTLDFDEELYPTIYIDDGDIIVFFANLYHNNNILDDIKKIILSDEYKNNINDYLLSVFNYIKINYGEIIAQIITMNIINRYVKNKNIGFIKIRKMLEKDLKSSMMMADTFAYAICETSKKDERYSEGNRHFINAIFIKHAKLLGDDVYYNVYPGRIGDKTVFCDIYTINSSRAAIDFDYIGLVKSKTIIKQCKNCERYFIPNIRSDEIYCNNMFKNNKTCKQLGYEIKVNSDEILKLYRTIYKTQNARKQRNKHILQIEARFKNWAVYSKSILQKCQQGNISLEEMKELLSTNDWICKDGDMQWQT